MASAGARVACVDINPDAVSQLREELGGRVLPLQADVSSKTTSTVLSKLSHRLSAL